MALDLGDVPTWLAAAAAWVPAAGQTISGLRRERGAEWVAEVDEQAAMESAAIADALKDPGVMELFERGFEAAIRSQAEAKRWLLARVVASAIRGDGLARPDELAYMMDTVEALQPGHVQLLTLLVVPRPGLGVNAGIDWKEPSPTRTW